jgi:hypothetical protein
VAGLLLYGKDFRAEHYLAKDNTCHHEIRPVDGDFLSISNTTWEQITGLCADFGAPLENWPVYDTSIDVPVEEVREKNLLLKPLLLAVPPDIVRSQMWLEKIVDRVRQGYQIVYCRLY